MPVHATKRRCFSPANTNALAEAYEYDPYGRHRVIDPGTDATYFTSDDTYAELAAGAINNAIRYTGQRFDAESGLMYYKNRYYDPAAGRFIGRDSLGWREGPNGYAYVGGMPTMAVDPLGLKNAPIRATYNASPTQRNRQQYGPALKPYTPPTLTPIRPSADTVIITPNRPTTPPAGPMIPPTLIGPKPRTYPDTVNWPNHSRNPFKPPYKPKYPKPENATCSQETYDFLVDMKTKMCGGPKCGGLEPTNKEDCLKIAAGIERIKDCFSIRQTITDICFGGITDDSHAGQERELQNALDRCNRKLDQCRKIGCWPP